LPSLAHESQPLAVFVRSWTFAHKHQLRMRVPLPWHGAGAALMQPAKSALRHGRRHVLQRVRLEHGATGLGRGYDRRGGRRRTAQARGSDSRRGRDGRGQRAAGSGRNRHRPHPILAQVFKIGRQVRHQNIPWIACLHDGRSYASGWIKKSFFIDAIKI